MNFAIVDWFGYNISPQDRMRFIKEAGFSSVLLLWADYFDKDYKQFPEYARNTGLDIENAHAPYMNANDLWEDTINGQAACEEIIGCVEDCAAYEIPTLVMHPENKKRTETIELPTNFTIGIERIKRIIDTAEKFNVNIAIENMSRPEYLENIFINIQSEKLGFCFDSGHYNLFTPTVDLLSLYGDKLMTLHLHDNDGMEDWHSLPFSGNIKWDNIAVNLNQFSYDGAIAFEVGNKRFENIKEPDAFLRLAIECADKIFTMRNDKTI